MLFVLIFIAAVFFVCVLSLTISRIDITFVQAMEVIYNHITGVIPDRKEDYAGWWIDQVITNDNAPRTICGVCVGAVLAISGAVMQSITRNPLTDPYTIGISSAAMFGVTITVVYGICAIPGLAGEEGKIVNAFVFALIPSAAIVFVSSFKKVSPTMMVLIGIALMYMFSAFTTFIKFNAESEKLQEIYEWSLGTLSKTDWGSVAVISSVFVLILVSMVILANRINVINAGEKESVSFGENPVRIRLVCFVIISLATAASVCYTGTIGFVGLVAPHIARLFVGSNCKILIPASAILGGLMVVGSDCIVRSISVDLPVGVITALIGSPLFIYFLFRQRRKAIW
ncbi:MAG: iron ABC transporter permease [Candidatus Methanomethylophilaceae archaeon]|nr:iron ABC transporter permease [Candidatus Methanomethylophilaceae archaeon]